MPEEPQLPIFNLDWSDADEMPISAANTFFVQPVPDGYVLNVGHGTPPINHDGSAPTTVKVDVAARILVTPRIAATLQNVVRDIARQFAGGKSDGNDS